MEIPSGKAVFKKKEGILTLLADLSALIWTPLPGTGPPHLSLSVSNISNLQQTPDSNPKVFLKVLEKAKPGQENNKAGASSSFLFQFTSPTDARQEANALKDILSKLLKNQNADPSLIQIQQGNGAASSVNGAASAGGSGSITASAPLATGKPPVAVKWLDDDTLRADSELQQSLLRKDALLRQTFKDAGDNRPKQMSVMAFNAQFWSTRVNLLRAHAIEQNQKKGAYNVLAVIKPRTVDGELKLNLNVEYIRMILQQFPLVKRLYNENVPKLAEGEFWSRFFLSRLAKRLKGERVGDHDHTDPLFDQYTEADNAVGFRRIMAQAVPHIIDLEGNEQHRGGFKGGNRLDVEMRPRHNVPIVQTLNSLSERIMAQVAPSDRDPANPDAGDDTTLREVALRDLQGYVEAQRIVLNVQDQSLLFSTQATGAQDPTEAATYAKQDPHEVLFEIQADLDTLEDDGAGGIDLHRGIGVNDESESEPDGDADDTQGPAQKPAPHVGSRAARKAAQRDLLDSIKKTRAEVYGAQFSTAAANTAPNIDTPMSIPSDITQRCYVTNATTVEFVRQFWRCFLADEADSPGRRAELAYMADAVRRCGDRIRALAEEAEVLRAKRMEEMKAEIMAYRMQYGKKPVRRPPPKGGRDHVMALFEGTLGALDRAGEVYKQYAEGESG